MIHLPEKCVPFFGGSKGGATTTCLEGGSGFMWSVRVAGECMGQSMKLVVRLCLSPVVRLSRWWRCSMPPFARKRAARSKQAGWLNEEREVMPHDEDG
jgi:hypothetical protein